MVRRILAVVILLLVMSGCSSKLAYNNLDWLIYWYTDDYVDLTKQQKAVMDQRLTQWLDWHRNTELVKYRTHLEQLKQDVSSDSLDTDRWQYHFDYGRSHWLRLRDHLAPELSELAVQLNDDQVTGMFVQIEKDNEEIEEDRFDGDEEERLEKRQKNILKQLKSFVGRPTKQQEQIVAQYAPQFRSNFDNWLQYRRDIQNGYRLLFAQRHGDAEFPAKLLQLMLTPDSYKSEEYRQRSQYNSALYASMAADLSASLTDKQTRRMLKELQGYIDDIDDLMETD